MTANESTQAESIEPVECNENDLEESLHRPSGKFECKGEFLELEYEFDSGYYDDHAWVTLEIRSPDPYFDEMFLNYTFTIEGAEEFYLELRDAIVRAKSHELAYHGTDPEEGIAGETLPHEEADE